MTHIVVLGAGYSGLLAARLAAARTDARVTLINQSDRFVERVRLHQLAAGHALRDRPLADAVRGTGIRLVVDRATAIDPDHRTIQLASAAEPIGYDLLCYALGSQADLDAVPGAAQHAETVASAEQAARLRDRLRPGAVVAVAGGGLTGIEAAAELAESHPDVKVRLVTGGTLGAALSERGQRHLRRVFGRLGVEVREHARIAEVRADGLMLADGGHVGADLVVWTTGFRVSPLARDAGLAVDEHGRVLVDQTLRSISHPEVSAVGDAAAAHRPTGQQLRMACATGLPTAVYAISAIADRLAGTAPRPLRFRYLNQCISLGRHDGLIQFVRADDSPVNAVLTGRLAARYKEFVVRGAAATPTRPWLARLAA